MPKKIILIRHGETEYNRDGRWQGWTDEPLNETGKSQSEKAAQRLKSEVIDAIFTSDLIRALQTAKIVGKPLGIPAIKTKNLRERNMGIFEGMTWEESEEKHKSLFENFFDHQNETFKDHGGETIKEVKKRIKAFLKEMKSKYKDKVVAIITHGGAKYYMLRLLVKEMPEDLRFGNTAITVLKKDRSGRYHITLLGDTSHLDQ